MVATPRPPLFSISLLSAGVLLYEIILMRLFSIIQWHHFAYMVISLALLGYGMSGTFVSLTQQHLSRRYNVAYVFLIMLCGVSSPLAFVLAQNIPFNAEEIFWNNIHISYLAAIFVVLALPFFFGATAICLTLRCYGRNVSRIYCYDLFGAGLASITVIGVLHIFSPQNALVFTGCLLLMAAGVAVLELRVRYGKTVIIVSVGLAIALSSAMSQFELEMSPYKALTQALRINGTRITLQYSTPLGLLSVVESTKVPLRHVPGMSLNNIQEPLDQVGVFTDGDNISVITKKAEKRSQLAYLDQVTAALPYHLVHPENVLILGAGAGADIIQAQYYRPGHIDAVELNPQIPALIRSEYAEYAGNVFDSGNVTLHIAEIRGFIKRTEQQYDIIQLALTDGFGGSAAGVYAVSESYLYTVEALRSYLSRLAPDGYLAITRWVKMPPRDTLKIFATAVASLNGIGNAANRLVLIRSWQTSTLLIKNGDFNTAELLALQEFCDVRSFDIAYSPALSKSQVNRYNILQKPLFNEAAQALVGNQAKAFIEKYKFAITPATDDKPYFHHFFKWSSLAEILALKQQGSAPLLESGYLVVVATVIAASLISGVLILLPLWLFRRGPEPLVLRVNKTYVLSFFFTIGMAFFFIEIAFLQKFILFLHHPVYAIATGLASFLVFAGLGSHSSEKIAKAMGMSKAMKLAVFGLALTCLVHVLTLDLIFMFLHEVPLVGRIVVAVFLIAPLATFMGIPFPLALQRLVVDAEHLVPWAWGINGCASVISASLATLLAIQFGFTLVIVLAILLYLFAYLLFTMKN